MCWIQSKAERKDTGDRGQMWMNEEGKSCTHDFMRSFDMDMMVIES